jgi:hypothetical protein
MEAPEITAMRNLKQKVLGVAISLEQAHQQVADMGK